MRNGVGQQSSTFLATRTTFVEDSFSTADEEWRFGDDLSPLHLLNTLFLLFRDQIRSVTQSCPTLCDPMNCSKPGLPVHHQILESTQTHVHWCHPTSPSSAVPFFPGPQSFPASGSFKWVSSSHQVAKLLEFQLQHQSFQGTPRADLL